MADLVRIRHCARPARGTGFFYSMTTNDIIARVHALATPLAAAQGVHVIEVKARPAKKALVIEVFADSEHGVDVEDLARLNRALGDVLETDPAFTFEYRIEVSSPGATAPLQFGWQYTRHVGRSLRATLVASESEKPVAITGELLEVTAGAITLQPDRAEPITLPFTRIHHAQVLLPW